MTKDQIVAFVKQVRVIRDVRIAATYVAKESGKGQGPMTTPLLKKINSAALLKERRQMFWKGSAL